MIRQKSSRKVAIMFTDMVGYSKLTGKDQKLALELLKEHDSILEYALKFHNGKIIKHIGDAIFAEFENVSEAVHYAVNIQNDIKKRNSLNTKDREILIRIGIHYGEVIEKNNDIYGDGVNIASQIEPLAPHGGIAVSEEIQKAIQGEGDLYSKKYKTFKPKGATKTVQLYQVFIHIMDWVEDTSLPHQNELEYDISTAKALLEKGDYSSALKSAKIANSNLSKEDPKQIESKLFIAFLLNKLGQFDIILQILNDLENNFVSSFSLIQKANLHKLYAEVYFNRGKLKQSRRECEITIELLEGKQSEIIDEVLYLLFHIHIKSDEINRYSQLISKRSSIKNTPSYLLINGIDLIINCEQTNVGIPRLEAYYKNVKKTCKSALCCAHAYWLMSKAYLLINEKDLCLVAQEEAQTYLLQAKDKISDFDMRTDFIKKVIIHQDIMKDLHFDYSDDEFELDDFGEGMDFDEDEQPTSSTKESNSCFQFCPNCGFNNSDQFQFCPNCGCNLST